MADTDVHFIELLGEDADGRIHADKTPCGIPAANGQLFFEGRALGASTIPSAVTCTGCSIRARVAEKKYAEREAAERAAQQKADDAAKFAAAVALVEASKKGSV